MSESPPPPLPRPLRQRLLQALLALPMTRSADGCRNLLANIPSNLRAHFKFEGDQATVLGNLITDLHALILESGESALAIVVEDAAGAAGGSTLAEEFEAILDELGGRAARRTKLREAYAKYLRGKYAQPNLRGLLPAEHLRLLGARVLLHDIYEPLTATIVQEPAFPELTTFFAKAFAAAMDSQSDDSSEESSKEVRHGDIEGPAKNTRERVPLDALMNESVVVILGHPGAGKSTFLKRYALTLFDREGEWPLPILVPLAAYAQALKDKSTLRITDFAPLYYQESGVPGLAPLFIHAQRTGQAVYLLDGLDEVASEWRASVSDQVVALAGRLGVGNQLVATSRITGYIPLAFHGYTEATLEPFDERQTAEFVRKWYVAFFGQQGPAAGVEKTAEKLLGIIHSNRGVAKLADNPLTLTMLALLFFAGNDNLPRQRIRLYRQVANTLIAEWHKARSLAGMPVGSGHDELEVLRRVGPLAYWMHDERPEGLATRAEVEHLLVRIERNAHPDEDPLPGVRRFLDQFDVGLLVEKGPSQWSFAHLTFEEYWAAREIARRPMKMATEIARRAPDPRWTEVIRLAIAYLGTELGATEDATALVEGTILQRTDPYEPYLHRNLLLAGRVLADEPGVEGHAGEAVARRVFDLLLNTNVTVLQESAGEVLREMQGTRLGATIARWVVEAIETRQVIGRFKALAADPAVRPALLAALSDDDSSVRGAAAGALAAVAADPAVRPALLTALAAPEWPVREAAAGALAGAADDPVVRAALLLYLTDEKTGVRVAAAGALTGAAGDPAVHTALLPLLADEDLPVRQVAAGALAGAATNPAVRAALFSLLPDEKWRVREGAAEALARTADDPTVRAALLSLLADKNWPVREAAAEALTGAAGDLAVRAALLPLLADEDWSVCEAAAEALTGAAGDPAVRTALLLLLADQNSSVRAVAVWALVRSTSELNDRFSFRVIFSQEDRRLRFTVRMMTEPVIDSVVRNALLARLTDKSEIVRAVTAGALAGTIGDSIVRAALLPLLADDQEYPRRAATEALAGAVSDPSVRAALFPLLADKNWSVRRTAAEASAGIADDPAIRAALVSLLTDQEGSVRQGAIRALAHCPPSVLLRRKLGNLLQDPMVAGPAYATLARWAEIEDAERAKRDSAK